MTSGLSMPGAGMKSHVQPTSLSAALNEPPARPDPMTTHDLDMSPF
jgi:hypothetical protein